MVGIGGLWKIGVSNMDRLTKKENVDYTTNATIHTVGFIVKGDRSKDYNNALNKLYEIENLEEELGCPLDVYIKATVYGVIVDGSQYRVTFHKDEEGYYFILSNGSAWRFRTSSYKKTWWLKRDKSE